MNTKEAFAQLISQRNWQKPANINKSTAASLERRFTEGKVTLDKMEEILHACGAKVVQEKVWTL